MRWIPLISALVVMIAALLGIDSRYTTYLLILAGATLVVIVLMTLYESYLATLFWKWLRHYQDRKALHQLDTQSSEAIDNLRIACELQRSLDKLVANGPRPEPLQNIGNSLREITTQTKKLNAADRVIAQNVGVRAAFTVFEQFITSCDHALKSQRLYFDSEDHKHVIQNTLDKYRQRLLDYNNLCLKATKCLSGYQLFEIHPSEFALLRSGTTKPKSRD